MEDQLDKPALGNKDQYPTPEIIFKHTGSAGKTWDMVFDHIHTRHPDLSEEWRYYNDGKCWLLKVTKKSKTVFWLSVLKDAFRITFYFADKAEPLIMDSPISGELKDQFRTGKRYNKIRGITMTITGNTDIENIRELIALKLKIK